MIRVRLSLAVLLALACVAVLAPSALAAPPANDNFAAAQPFPDGGRGFQYGNTTDATTEAGEPTVSGSDTAQTIWYRWKATASGFIRVSTCTSSAGSLAGTSVAVYGGSSVSSLTSYGESTAGCGTGGYNAVTGYIAVTAGETYFIQVGANTGATGPVSVSVDFNTAVPVNDNLAGAQEISGSLPLTVNADNGLATTEAGEPGSDFDSWTNSLWFKWTAPADMEVSIDTCGSTYSHYEPDTRLAVYEGTGTPGYGDLTHIDDNDDGCSANYLSSLDFSASNGTTYWIRLANYGSPYGSPYKLRILERGALTNIAAPEIEEDGAVKTGDTLKVSPGEWVTAAGAVTTTQQWQRCDATGGNCADIDGQTTTSHVATVDDVGHTLRALVTASDGTDTQQLLTPPSRIVGDGSAPANDDFAAAADLGSAQTATADGVLDWATIEPDEAFYGAIRPDNTLWYRWSAPYGQSVTIDTCDAPDLVYHDFITAVSVYTGDGSIAGSTRVAGSSNGCASGLGGRVTFTATVGTTYWIQVSNTNYSLPGSFRLKVALADLPKIAAADPFPAPKLAKLGKVKISKSGKVDLKKLSVSCGSTATSACKGTLTVTTKKTKIRGKTVKSVKQSFKISIAPGKNLGTNYKLSSKLRAAVKKAKKLGATVKIAAGAPGFAQKSASTSLTLTK